MLTPKDLKRYDRQIKLLGEAGQEKLKRAKVFIAGAGGLGSPISIYLTAAGIGSITLVDNDTVELSNLNRQVLHWEKDTGRYKVESAEEKLSQINSDIEIEAQNATLTEDNISNLVNDADLIIDAMDNYPVRYLLNRMALSKKIPFIHGAINGFHGQATTVLPGRSACLRCIFRKAPPPSKFPVIGVTPGIIGLVQANEAIKYLTEIGELLDGKLLLWDGLTSRTEILEVQRDPKCPECKDYGRGHDASTK
jgi:molybdopterin/thiamine biosynthesis adenylyltransferase